jgi:DNA-binding winged helix-turn-helix (wHTH) protein
MIIALSAPGAAKSEIDTQLFEVRHAGKRSPIEPQVYDVLVYLIQHRDRVVPRSELLQRLWPNCVVSDAALSHCVMAARKAVGDTGRRQCIIKTHHRRGYRVVASVTTNHGVPDSKRLRAQSDANWHG